MIRSVCVCVCVCVRVCGVCVFQVDGSVWATVLALIWLYVYKLDQQVEWQFVAVKAASWIRSQKCETTLIHSFIQCLLDMFLYSGD